MVSDVSLIILNEAKEYIHIFSTQIYQVKDGFLVCKHKQITLRGTTTPDKMFESMWVNTANFLNLIFLVHQSGKLKQNFNTLDASHFHMRQDVAPTPPKYLFRSFVVSLQLNIFFVQLA